MMDPISVDSTMGQLQSAIIKALELVNVLPSCIQIKFICPPPKVISEVPPSSKLSCLNLTSGNLIVSVLEKPPAIAQPANPKEEVNDQKEDILEEEENGAPNELNGTMTLKEIASDNSCLFNAVLFCAEEGVDDKQKGAELREVIASIVMSSPQQYNEAILGQSNGEYVQYILKPNTWGGAIELSILSTYYEVQINAIDVVTLQIHRFGEDRDWKQCIYVIYDGIHYDSLIMKCPNGTIVHRFGTNDDSVLAQAVSIAADRNQKKQFTDVYNFGLICNVCGTKLKGQSEAQKHAESTGHQQFSQYQ